MKATKAIFAAREINQLVIDPAVKGKGGNDGGWPWWVGVSRCSF